MSDDIWALTDFIAQHFTEVASPPKRRSAANSATDDNNFGPDSDMSETAAPQPNSTSSHYDVIIVGAGISGVGAAYHMQDQAPGKTFRVLEAQSDFGGTWRTHRYPGVRSDSDLYTFGYRFKPWSGTPIATAPEILAYMSEVIAENDLARHIEYGVTVVSAKWSTVECVWTLEVEDVASHQRKTLTAGFLWMCQGYYRHNAGYVPDWPGMPDFNGRIVHPQNWPEDLDYAGKRMIVIGSGATAATLVPAIVNEAEHVTMLQRSPTYFTTGRNRNDLAETLRDLDIDPHWTHEIVRRSVLREGALRTRRALEQPAQVREEILGALNGLLGEEEVQKNFTPRYDPWRQRIAFIPDADFFDAIKSGKASVITDEIDTFVPEGIRLKSGEILEADIVVTATGFELNVLGDIDFFIDNASLDLSESVTYRGMMFTGVPNLVWVFGYFRASWTLRADLIGDFVPRLLHHMDAIGVRRVEPRLRDIDADMALSPWIDPADFNPGYLTRGLHLMPKSGSKREWRHTQDYWSEKDEFPAIDLADPIFAYG
ncbi:flavin-containing monooxygenase [Phenylobacterium sp.]|uniref:flavin-containing monooxygenase n=1 Tax=Phenylobacterium sp. TaxID=1871053 RepID=UPI0035B163F3